MNTELNELRSRISQLGRCSAKVALLEEAIRLADSTNDAEAGFELRKELTFEGIFTGHPDKSLVAFSWNLGQADRDPERFDERELLFQYKWIVHSFRHFPQISQAQIESALADLSRRFERNGASLRPAHKLRCQLAWDQGNESQVVEYLPLWKRAARDWLSDCVACDQDGLVSAHIFLRKDRQAVRFAKPILDGKLRCSHVPHCTYAEILTPLVRLKRLDEAAECHRLGYRLVKDQLVFVSEQGFHMLYLVQIQDYAAALKLFERHLRLALAVASPLSKLFVYRASMLLFERLEKPSGALKRTRFPKEFPLWNEAGKYPIKELATYFRTEAEKLASQFDARNGNTFYATSLAELL